LDGGELLDDPPTSFCQRRRVVADMKPIAHVAGIDLQVVVLQSTSMKECREKVEVAELSPTVVLLTLAS